MKKRKIKKKMWLAIDDFDNEYVAEGIRGETFLKTKKEALKWGGLHAKVIPVEVRYEV